MKQDQADALQNCIYDAVADDAALGALPGHIAALAGGKGCFAAINYANQNFGFMCSTGLDTDFMSAYATEFVKGDPWEPIATALPHNRFHNMDRHLPARQLLASPFYNEMQKPYREDIAHITVATLAISGGGVTENAGVGVISTQRSTKQGPFDDDVEKRLQPFVPHLRRLVQARQTLLAARQQVNSLNAMFDCLPTGVLQVDACAYVLYANAAAGDLLRGVAGKGDGIFYSAGRRLCAHAHSDTVRLHAAIARACTGPDGGAVLIRRLSGAMPLQLVITPFRTPQQLRTNVALILIQDPASQPAGLDKALTQMYGLSPGEAELAVGVAAGHELCELAERREVAMSTVRTMFKRALEKTGLRKQAALAGLVSRVPVMRTKDSGR